MVDEKHDDSPPTKPSDETPRPVEQEEVEERGSRLSRLASNARAAVTSARNAPRSSRFATLRKFMLPIATLLFLAIVVILFKEILLPFILALVIVYLMEPIVGRVGRTKESPSGLPRWVAVILVYLSFFGVLTVTVVFFVPTLVSEIVRFSETVPEEIQNFRTKTLPDLNQRVQSLVGDFAPKIGDEPDVVDAALSITRAKATLSDARAYGASSVTAQAAASRGVHLATAMTFSRVQPVDLLAPPMWTAQASPDALSQLSQNISVPRTGEWTWVEGQAPADIRVVPDPAGGFSVYLNDVDLELSRIDDKAWHVRHAPPKLPSKQEGSELNLSQMLDLERGLDEFIKNVSKSSNAKLSSLLGVAQQIVVGIIQAFVALILTLMVAAFISIDLPGLMSFFKNMIPREYHQQYDVLLVNMDRGLSGVVRGQLLICLVNGILTYVGLLLLGVKFSLLLAIVAGCLSLIPIFGTILSTIPIVLFGLTDGFMTGVFALLWILFIHFLEANILNPKIIGTSAHIHPVIVIFALLAGESAFGLLGALLAVPTASILLTLFKFFLMRSGAQVQPAEATKEVG